MDSATSDHVWLLMVATNEIGKDGEAILPERILLSNSDNLDEEIEKAGAAISKQIDWGIFQDDLSAPYIKEYNASGGIVGINDELKIVLAGDLPSSGIDMSSIEVIINGTDASEDITVKGDPYEYEVSWKPPAIVYG